MRAYLLSSSPLTSNGGAAMPARELLDEALSLASWYLTVEKPETIQHGKAFDTELTGVAGAMALTTAIQQAIPSAPDDTLVLFTSGPALHDKVSFLDQAGDAAEDDPPIFLWVAFELTEHDDGTRSVFTRGATALGATLEVEIDHSQRSAEELLERAADAVLVAMTPGNVIEDGDTIELSEDTVRVRIQPSLRGTGDKAFRLRVP